MILSPVSNLREEPIFNQADRDYIEPKTRNQFIYGLLLGFLLCLVAVVVVNMTVHKKHDPNKPSLAEKHATNQRINVSPRNTNNRLSGRFTNARHWETTYSPGSRGVFGGNPNIKTTRTFDDILRERNGNL